MEIVNHASPNFGKRAIGFSVNLLLIHYTGMKTCTQALKRLSDPASGVSSHYLINETGVVYRLVDERYRAWHAGVSQWKGISNLNNNSIGIELENPGHEFGYIAFSKKQMEALVFLCKELKSRYDIQANWVLGHSDISPFRKNDPGEKFPWKKLSKHNLGFFPKKLTEREYLQVKKKLNLSKNNSLNLSVLYMLSNIGYDISQIGKNNRKNFFLLIRAYQMHFRQKVVNGKLDKETLKMIVSHFNQTLTI